MGDDTLGYRVVAMRSADGDKKVAYIYGEGVYVGDRHPPNGTMTMLGPVNDDFPKEWTNPCIVLDGGGVVWGCQCWWGPVEKMRQRFGEYTWETVDVAELDNPPLPSDG
jgi:hypothetical protein